MIKVAVGIPTAGNTQSLSMHCLWLLGFHLGKYQSEHPEFEFHLILRERGLVSVNREYIAGEALKIGCDYIFFIDDDMVFRPDLFERLYRHNVDIVAALAFTRNPNHLPVMYQLHEGFDTIEKKPYCRIEWIKNYPRKKLVEVDAVGFGSVLIKTHVFKKMTPPFFMCSSTSTGEDIFFCMQAKKSGVRIFCDTSTVLGHLSNPQIIDESTYERFNDPEEMIRRHAVYDKYEVREIIEDDKIPLDEVEVIGK